MTQDMDDAELDGGAAKDVEADTLVVTLHRPDSEQPMGLRLDVSEPTGSIFIARVAADPGTVVGSYNEEAPEHQLIRKGNYIVAVDGNKFGVDVAASGPPHVQPHDQAGTDLHCHSAETRQTNGIGDPLRSHGYKLVDQECR